ncbi:MAG TPA: GTPase HflX [Leptospiraceae bacterium]|nr:GTPase HflX [Leptospiraceae bacterium]HMW07359.1 GTPase HflX [Leptospiraceae bacterium]HMX34387.1 GTPase HflX [Leptospiraceae bacterium]HMY32933.1 GTPase HflX [Leptospiraceae bacterium]HMZ64547.1 GTPase HflX [Leptospiraceae bacterium]
MDIARIMGEIARDINRQIGILIDRTGYISHVMVGDYSSIEIPYLDRTRSTGNRLRGLRLIHTHLKDEKLSEEDLADLVLLRLDYITAIIPDEVGNPKFFYSAHANADPESDSLWVVLDKQYPGQLKTGFADEIQDLEFNLSKFKSNLKEASGKNRAFLIGVQFQNQKYHRSIESSIHELKELCRTADIHVVESFYQKKKSLDPATVIGVGKIKEILLKAVQKEVELLIFDLDLSPSQAKKISDFCDLKVIDRTQLILDIFARNAKSRDGKLQVELAQLKYLKGRLSELDDNMSRLTGGIGGRGPGETKLEIGKRRVEEKISRLEKELKSLRQRRELNRKQRKRNEIPVVAIVGYTNAGKSTLLNVLTNSDVIAENKLFATLDPTTRRIRFPEEREIILSDTVGFIHDLPPDLTNAFKATLEELGDADLLLHVIDISNPNHNEHIQSVENILSSLELLDVKRINVYNKIDQMEEDFKTPKDGIGISTLNRIGLEKLLETIEKVLWESS